LMEMLLGSWYLRDVCSPQHHVGLAPPTCA
jgi:hypothetical protein